MDFRQISPEFIMENSINNKKFDIERRNNGYLYDILFLVELCFDCHTSPNSC